MIPYYIVFLISIIFMIPFTKGKLSTKLFELNSCKIKFHMRTFLFYLSSLPIFLLSALRYEIGTDYLFAYKPLFNQIRFGMKTNVEPIFVLINKVISMFTNEFQVVIVVTSLIFVWLYYKIILDSEHKIANIILLLLTQTYIYSFNNIRQSIAVAIMVAAIYTIEDLYSKKGLLKFVFAQLLALGFHTSSIIYSIIYVLYFFNIKFSLSKKLIIFIPIIVYAFRSFIASNIFIKLLALFKLERYQWYFGKTVSAFFTSYAEIEIIINIIIYLFILLVECNSTWEKKENTNNLGMIIQILITSIAILSPFITLSHRILRLLTPIQIFYTPELAKKFSKKYNVNYYIILLILITLFGILFYFEICRYNYEECNPYKTFIMTGVILNC